MEEKLESFVVKDEFVIAGIKLRPFTAGSLIMLQMIKNPLVMQDQEGLERDAFYHIASFFFIHAGDLDQVRSVVSNESEFKMSVIKFAEGFSAGELINSGELIKKMIESATVGQDYNVEGEPSPN